MERHDLIVNDQYSMDLHHSEEAGVKIRKKIWMVTGLLTLITVVEIVMGVVWGKAIAAERPTTWEIIRWSYIVLTIIKAGYIVMVFMHLGDERKGLRSVILVPYFIFMLYLIFIALWEGLAVGVSWPSTFGM